MRYDDIRAGLLSFFPSPSLTPGRLNIIRAPNGARLLVDYAHNAAAMEGLIDFVFRLRAGRRIATVTMPGDRRDEDIRNVGRLVAKFDHVILREDEDRRGRSPGTIAALMKEGLLEAGVSEDRIDFIPDEIDALKKGISLLGEEDMFVIIVDKVTQTLALVRELLATPVNS
jgi:cyanophycin synthetase